jgi:hypothetical protein
MAPVSCDRIISLVAANREIRNEFWVATLEYKLKDFLVMIFGFITMQLWKCNQRVTFIFSSPVKAIS